MLNPPDRPEDIRAALERLLDLLAARVAERLVIGRPPDEPPAAELVPDPTANESQA